MVELPSLFYLSQSLQHDSTLQEHSQVLFLESQPGMCDIDLDLEDMVFEGRV